MQLSLEHKMNFKRKITTRERVFYRSTHANVVMVVRIKGDVSSELLRSIIRSMPKRHPLLQVRVICDVDDNLWFTSEGVQELQVQVIPRKSDDHWFQKFKEECKLPFQLDKGPLIRFFLLYSAHISELIIFCHHLICDGMSLAFLARDILIHLGDPSREIELLPTPTVLNENNIPSNAHPSPLKRKLMTYFINRYNKRWQSEKLYFDEEDYKNIYQAYWENYTHHNLLGELSELETSKFVSRSRQEGVTVNTALITAFLKAKNEVQGVSRTTPQTIGQPVNIRKRLKNPPGEAFGLYVAGFELNIKYNPNKSFWEQARFIHKLIKNSLTDQSIFEHFFAVSAFDGTLFDVLPFLSYSKFIPPHFSRYKKLSTLSEESSNVVNALIKSLGKQINMIVTNLGQMDFPKNYGSLELDSLILLPGGGVTCELTVGVVSAAGKLCYTIEHLDHVIDKDTGLKINARVMEILTKAIS
ncbi:MAG: condensation domain-containing protein [Promethearchaeota archaeon]